MRRTAELARREIRGFMLKFLYDAYPEGITLKLIEALLPPWGYFCSQADIRKALGYLLDRNLVITRDVELPADISPQIKVHLTALGYRFLVENERDPEIILPAELDNA